MGCLATYIRKQLHISRAVAAILLRSFRAAFKLGFQSMSKFGLNWSLGASHFICLIIAYGAYV
jgi:hypothetical protein